ncbi:MAG: glutamate--tRNA ligase family protein [Kiritimatiellaeota bacterium]|nr:glutamate--tRNA ligase family protein [Kiritimatiellota bacterium]
MTTPEPQKSYRGRLAPTPTGYLHLGHARTFWLAQERARAAGGKLLLRVEDIDRARCKSEFTAAMLEDLRWFGFAWDEGPDVGGPFASYTQSERRNFHLEIWRRLLAGHWIYPSAHSRKDLERAPRAPHEGEAEPLFPSHWRPAPESWTPPATPDGINWRFRVPDGKRIEFVDGRCGRQSFEAGRDFGDFVVWRRDGVPAYELVVAADDHAMEITEVVRGEDLLLSTARQLLIYRALAWTPPAWFHCPLLRDAAGQRLAKRTAALSLRELRAAGQTPEQLRAEWAAP